MRLSVRPALDIVFVRRTAAMMRAPEATCQEHLLISWAISRRLVFPLGRRPATNSTNRREVMDMPISQEDREAYERGREDNERGLLGALVDGFSLSGSAFEYGYEGSQLEAYRKGLSGEQFDEDD